MNAIGGRLREERDRLDLSQDEMAERGGVKRAAQSNYERGDRCPDAQYLAALSVAGLDVQYVVTGVRSGNKAVSVQQSKVLDAFNAAGPQAQAAGLMVMEALAGYQAAAPAAPSPEAAEAIHWRAVARNMLHATGVDLSHRVTLVDWLRIVDQAAALEWAGGPQGVQAQAGQQQTQRQSKGRV